MDRNYALECRERLQREEQNDALVRDMIATALAKDKIAEMRSGEHKGTDNANNR